MLQLIHIIILSYILTLFVVSFMVTVGIDVKSINGQDAYVIILQIVLILMVLVKIWRFIYGRR
jgi:hypothetical protein